MLKKKIPISVVKTITKGVQYKILFLIKYNGEYSYVIKVDDSIYNSEWNDNIKFSFNAINLQVVYKNIVKSIIGEEDNNKRFEEIIDDRNKKINLKKQVNHLKQKIKAEKQFNRKIELNVELNKLLDEMEVLCNE